MARRRKAQRFAQKALLVIAIWLAVFSAAQMAIFAVTGVEQTQLIESTFVVIGLECGGLLVKRILEKVLPGKREEE